MHQIIILAALLCSTCGGHAAGLNQEMMEELKALQSNWGEAMRGYDTADASEEKAKEQEGYISEVSQYPNQLPGSAPRKVVDAFEQQLRDGTYRGNDIWLVNKDLVEKSAADQPSSEFLDSASLRGYDTSDAAEEKATVQRNGISEASKMAYFQSLQRGYNTEEAAENNAMEQEQDLKAMSAPRRVVDAFEQQLRDGTYRGNDIWLVNKDLAEKSATQPSSKYFNSASRRTYNAGMSRLRNREQAKEQRFTGAYKMDSSMLEEQEEEEDSAPEDVPPREVMEAFEKQIQAGKYKGDEIWLKNSEHNGENVDQAPSRDSIKKLSLELEDSRFQGSDVSDVYQRNRMESSVLRDRNQLAEAIKSELEGGTNKEFNSFQSSNYYRARSQSLKQEDGMYKTSELESLLMPRQKNLDRKLDLSQVRSSGLVQLSTDAIKDTLQGAMEELATEAQALIENEVCNFIANRLSNFGPVTTDPITLTVEENRTVNLFEIFEVPGGSSVPIPLERVIFDCSNRQLTIETRPYGSQTIIPEEMELANIACVLFVDLTDTSTLKITFSGEWTISGQQIDVQVVYTRETDQFDITATPTGVNIDVISLANDLTGLEVPNPFGDALTFTSLVLSGTIQSDATITLSLKMASRLKIVYLIYHKPSESVGQKMIAVNFENFQFSSLISSATGVDVSGVPYFGTLMTPVVGLTISKENISGLPSTIFSDSPLLDLLTESGANVFEGTWAALKFDFFESPIQFRVQGSLKFTPLGRGLSVDRLLSVIPGVDKNIPLPIDTRIISSIDVISFSLSSDPEDSLSIELNYDDGLSFFNDLIEIHSVTIILHLSRQPPKLKAELSGDLTLGETSFSVSLFLDDNDDYVIEATASSLPISDAIAQFHASILPPEINSVLSDIPFVHFSFRNPRLIYPLSSVPQQIQIGGTPVIDGNEIVTAEVLAIKERSGIILVEGFDIGRVNLADLIETVTTFDVSSIPLLNHDLEAAILISPKTLPDAHLHGKLENFAITRGVSVQAEMSFPSDCSSDPFCAVAQSLLGADARLSLRGTMSSADRFELFAGVSDIQVGGGLTISNAGLEVEAGTDPTIGVIGAIILADPPITLTSRIFLSPSGVVLSMSQSGCWNNAFRANWLSICNVLGSVGLAPGVAISRLEVGGEIRLGNPRCSSPITATGFFGIDVVTPTNNYYYVQFTGRTTVTSLIQAFCVNINLPRPLGESGFPNGFLSSFSLAGHELPHAGIVIPAGYRLKGTLNILGLQGFADITIGLPEGFHFHVALPVINVGNGLLRMSRSARDTSHGPFLNAKIVLLPSPNVDIEARGFVHVLGFSVESSLRITKTQYQFSLSGRMLNLFEADLFMSASYGSLSRASFRVKGHFRNSLYSRIESRIKQVLRDSANVATAHIKSAQDEVNRKHADFDNAVSALRGAQRDVNGANANFDAAEGKVRGAREKVRSVCKIRNCGSVCVGCPTCCDCCGRVWGGCVCWRPGWRSCCTRVPDPICHSANTVCKGLIATAEGVLHAAEATINTAQHSLKVAEGILIAARHTVDKARVSLHIANAALKAASATYKAGTSAAQKIATVGLNGLVSIHEISFDVDLRQARTGFFSGSVRAKFLGHAEVNVSLKVNLRDITSMAKELAEQIGDGFSDLFS